MSEFVRFSLVHTVYYLQCVFFSVLIRPYVTRDDFSAAVKVMPWCHVSLKCLACVILDIRFPAVTLFTMRTEIGL